MSEESGARNAIDPEPGFVERIEEIIDDLRARRLRESVGGVPNPVLGRCLSLAITDLESAQNWLSRAGVR